MPTPRLTADSPLTARKQRFVEEYLKDLNGAAAAVRAGYSVRTAREQASQLLSQPHVAAAVARAKAERAAKSNLTKEWVIRRLRIEATRKGEGSSHAARVRATELLAKHLGVLDDPPPAPPSVTVNVGTPGPPDLGKLNDDQLADLAALLRAAESPAAGPARPADRPPAGL